MYPWDLNTTGGAGAGGAVREEGGVCSSSNQLDLETCLSQSIAQG